MSYRLAALALLAYAPLASLACGGGAPASVPPKVDIPAAPASGAPSSPAAPSAGDAGVQTLVVPPSVGQPDDPELARYRAILAAPDRQAGDRALDGGRHPVELLAFAEIHEGMRVAEIGAWKGYTADLLARAVGTTGHVWAQDPASFDKETRGAWAARMLNPMFHERVTHVAREFDDPLPPDAHDLDAVLIILFYHDTVWLNVDRARMNRAIFAALRKGGEYVVVDHSANLGSGVTFAQKLHRIEESVVRREIEAAGFTLAGEAEFLKNPGDQRDWNSSDQAPDAKRGTSDRFVLKYLKP
jgi:predicted methyltransferase